MEQMKNLEQMKALHRAIKTAGSMRELGLLIGCTTGQVAMWKRRGVIPPQYAISIERAVGVARSRTRPDLYPVDESPEVAIPAEVREALRVLCEWKEEMSKRKQENPIKEENKL